MSVHQKLSLIIEDSMGFVRSYLNIFGDYYNFNITVVHRSLISKVFDQ